MADNIICISALHIESGALTVTPRSDLNMLKKVGTVDMSDYSLLLLYRSKNIKNIQRNDLQCNKKVLMCFLV